MPYRVVGGRLRPPWMAGVPEMQEHFSGRATAAKGWAPPTNVDAGLFAGGHRPRYNTAQDSCIAHKLLNSIVSQ